MISFIVIAIVSYLFGSIPFGLVLTHLSGKGDIRKIGSGNIGATNVLRTGSKGLALITLLLDTGKGAFAVFLANGFAPETNVVAGIFALLGHMYPVWLDFKGGKGVATACGVLLVLSWPVAVVSSLIWLASVLTTQISSLSAIISAACAPVLAFFWAPTDVFGLVLVLAIFIIYKHKTNIQRLLNGTEPKVGEKKPVDKPASP
jgi:acyl phosphate:glycerol-3-phosphate acyltransferase